VSVIGQACLPAVSPFTILAFGLITVPALVSRASDNLTGTNQNSRSKEDLSVGLFQRLFGATRSAIALPRFDGSNAVNISVTILRKCIERGSAGPQGPHRARLAKPFARGYLFGFSDACIQQFGVFEELESLALITLVHVRIFGHKIGSLLVGDALRDEPNAEFGRGRIAGGKDLLRWLDDRSHIPLLLTRFLQADDATSCPMVPTRVSPAKSDIAPTNVATLHSPSRRNTAPVGKKVIAEATSDKRATIIRLRTRLHVKTVKRIEGDEH
jgi:hypothetical protein